MKNKLWGCAVLLLASVVAFAQGPPPGPGGPGGRPGMVMRDRSMGAWWKNSDVASKLHLTDQQVQQLENAFYQHRLKLVDLRANIEKQDLQLEKLLDASTPDDSAILAQVDQRSNARNQLDREFTQMTLDFRKILTPDQWKQLRSLLPPPGDGRIREFIRQHRGPGGPGMHPGPDGPGGPGENPPPPPSGSLP